MNQIAGGICLGAGLIGFVSESHVHVGTGQSVDALDLPVARERVTQFPFIPGSGVKGAFNVWAKERAGLDGKVTFLFGREANKDDGGDGGAGALLCSDARLLLLPVRSLSGAYKWITCPSILSRLTRDISRAGVNLDTIFQCSVTRKHYRGKEIQGQYLALEEREFQNEGSIGKEIIDGLSAFIPHAIMRQNLEDYLTILHDDDFTWFAKYALPIMSRNALDENKIVKRGALWHEETIAPDTVFYAMFGERRAGAIDDIKNAIRNSPYIQMGGNETIGQGWFGMALYGEQIQSGEVL